MNLIIGLVNGMLSGVEKGVNGIIKNINKLSFKVPDWVPGIGGENFGFALKTLSIPRIPMLAQGGYVRAHTPQLAVIGDNRTQGEIMAPENKMAELLQKAVSAGGDNSQVVALLSAILELMRSGVVLLVNDKVLGELALSAANRANRAGYQTVRI